MLAACHGSKDIAEPAGTPSHAEVSADAPAARTTETPSSGPLASTAQVTREPATVERLEVPNDAPAFVVRGAPGATLHTVFMPGRCSNAYAYLLSFPEAARAHGGIVAIEGDEPCGPPSSGFHTLSWNPTRQHARITAALAAAGVSPPEHGITLVGYSSGASVAELMHAEGPSRYPRLLLIAPPVDPQMSRLRDAQAVVTMACSLDVTSRMKVAAQRLRALDVPSEYVEMPGCTHGNVADGERLFGDAFEWLDRQGAMAEAKGS